MLSFFVTSYVDQCASVRPASAEYAREPEPERITATVYGASLLLATTMVSITWRSAVGSHLVRPDLRDRDAKTLTQQGCSAPGATDRCP